MENLRTVRQLLKNILLSQLASDNVLTQPTVLLSVGFHYDCLLELSTLS